MVADLDLLVRNRMNSLLPTCSHLIRHKQGSCFRSQHRTFVHNIFTSKRHFLCYSLISFSFVVLKMKIQIVDCRDGGIFAHGDEIYAGIATVGFVYLKNVGFISEEVSKVFKVADDFWSLSDDTKAKYARSKNYERDGNTGYVAPNVELLNPKSSAELREAFNYRPDDYVREDIDKQVPHFIETLKEFSLHCFQVSMDVLKVLAKGLDFPNDFFEKNHSLKESATTLRLLHYPPLPADVAPGTVRCGEHSDYGTITLLFQDDIGGLEVCGRDGRFVAATPEPDAVLINTGDLLQRWTSDRILAVRHRVLIPDDDRLYRAERRSIAFFVQPNDETVVKPLDGATTYEPVTAKEHLMNMFKKTY